LRSHLLAYEVLMAAYEQLDAAVGQFGRDSEVVSTTAAESSSPGDSVYQGFNQQLATCEAARDEIAGKIKTAINDAAFGGGTLSSARALGRSLRAGELILEMHALSRMSPPPRFSACHS